MAIFLLIAGALFLISGVQGTYKEFGAQLKQDIFGGNGQTGFLLWAAAIFVIGAIGYIQSFEKLSRAFLVLIFAVMFFSKQGIASNFFNLFTKGIKQESSGSNAAPVIQSTNH